MNEIEQHVSIEDRNSSIELLKVFGIILIVISHVIQTLHTQNTYILTSEYVLDISIATTNIQQLILTLLRYCGALGNTIFFVCSAWFLLDNDTVSKKKVFSMLMDVWIISIIILSIVWVIRDGNIDLKMFIAQILPTTFENNWYITCYLLFYSLHPLLNLLIKSMGQRDLLNITLVLLFLYVFVNYIIVGSFFSSSIVLWVTLYFAIAYMKYYLINISNKTKINVYILVFGIVGNISLVLLTNYLGLHFEIFERWLLRWNTNCSPFLILAAISMFNIAKNTFFYNKTINYISSLSLLIYIFHENRLLRTYYRPLMWNYIYNQFGYENLVFWTFALVVIVFSFGLIASIIYKNTIKNIALIICDWLYPILQKIHKRIESNILKIH